MTSNELSVFDLDMPSGFRFTPTDMELVRDYLNRKCKSLPIRAWQVIAEVDLYKFDPWQLPGMATYGEKEWYFFTPRDRKYPGGSRPNRATPSGFWKATGVDKKIGSPALGIKKSLVFYAGKRLTEVKTDWIMHEYRLDVERSASFHSNSRLDDWVLCRIFHKKGEMEIPRIDTEIPNTERMAPPPPPQQPSNPIPPYYQPSTHIRPPQLPPITMTPLLPPNPILPQTLPPRQPAETSEVGSNVCYLEPSDLMTRLNTWLSVSEPMSSSGVMQEKGVQNADRRPWEYYEDGILFDIPEDFFNPSFDNMDENISPLDDIFNSPKD